MPVTTPVREVEPLVIERPPEPDTRREWMLVAIGLTALVSIIAAAVALVAFATSSQTTTRVVTRTAAAKSAAPATAVAAATKIEDAKGVGFEAFKPVDPTLPAVPAGAVK
jgi:hypothetical protein